MCRLRATSRATPCVVVALMTFSLGFSACFGGAAVATPTAAPAPVETRAAIYSPGPFPSATATVAPTATIAPTWTPTATPTAILDTPEAMQASAEQPPYPVPASCRATPLQGPYNWRAFPAYWLVGDGVRAGIATQFLYANDPESAGGNKIMWQLGREATITLAGEFLDGAAPPPDLDVLYEAGAASYVSGLSFAVPGCWRLQVMADTQTLDAVVYVYPWACLPDRFARPPGTPTPTPEPSPAACVPPAP